MVPALMIYKSILYLLFPLFLFYTVLSDNRSESFAGGLLLLGAAFFVQYAKRCFLLTSKVELLLLSVFVGYGCLSIIVFYSWPSTSGSALRVLDDIKFILFVPLYFLFRCIDVKPKHLSILFFAFLVVIAAVVLAQYLRVGVILDYYPRYGRPSAGVNPMRFALVALIAFLVVASFIVVYGKIHSKRSMLSLATLTLVGVTAIVLPDVRGVWVAIPVIVIVITYYLFRRGMKKPLVVTGIAFVVALAGVSQFEGVQKRLKGAVDSLEAYRAGDGRSSVGTRLDMYYVSILLFAERPFTGHGLGAFQAESQRIKQEGRISGLVHEQLGKRRTPHNEMLQALIEKGVLGGLITIILFGLPMVVYHRAAKKGQLDSFYFGLTGMTVSVAFIVAGQTGTLLNHNLLTNMFIVLTLLFVSQIMRLGEVEKGTV